MRLTYASLASFIKYPWTSLPTDDQARPKSNKYGVFQSELEYFNEIARATGLLQKGDDWYCRHHLVHLMEVADDFCYGLLDLEDGMEMGILSWEEVFEILSPILSESQQRDLQSELESLSDGRRSPPLFEEKLFLHMLMMPLKHLLIMKYCS